MNDIVPVVGEDFEQTLAAASPDLLREMIRQMAQRMTDAEVEQIGGAGYGEVSPERVNSRNGYRRREWGTRAGTIEPAIPRLRSGSYYPEWLLERRRRAERALASVVATSEVAAVNDHGVRQVITVERDVWTGPFATAEAAARPDAARSPRTSPSASPRSPSSRPYNY